MPFLSSRSSSSWASANAAVAPALVYDRTPRRPRTRTAGARSSYVELAVAYGLISVAPTARTSAGRSRSTANTSSSRVRISCARRRCAARATSSVEAGANIRQSPFRLRARIIRPAGIASSHSGWCSRSCAGAALNQLGERRRPSRARWGAGAARACQRSRVAGARLRRCSLARTANRSRSSALNDLGLAACRSSRST